MAGCMEAVVMKPIKETAKRNIGSLPCARSLNTGYPEPDALAVKRLTAQNRDRFTLELRRLVLPRSSTTPNRATASGPSADDNWPPGSYYKRGRLSCGMHDDKLVLPAPAPTQRLIVVVHLVSSGRRPFMWEVWDTTEMRPLQNSYIRFNTVRAAF